MDKFSCAYCGTETERERSTKRFCSSICAQRHARGWPKSRTCRHCNTAFEVRERRDANRQHCSKQCAKNTNTKNVRSWKNARPGYMGQYNRNRIAKNPGAYRDSWRKQRAETIALLGGGCVVCGVTNQNWLHVDYIPTTRNEPFRHPRHLRWIRDNASKFRLLCANHHYELTLTGQIAGTNITQ